MRNKKVKIPIYSGDMLLLHDTDTWDEINRKYKMDLDNQTVGVVFPQVTDYGYTQYVVAFRGIPSNKIMVHESVHLVNILFKTIGVKLDIDNDEAQAYLTEWFFEQIENFFKND